jgi:ATP-dependent DNA helicase RecG
MNLSTDIGELKGVGKLLKERFITYGIENVEDLINYYPRRYDDYSRVIKIRDLEPGKVSLKVKFSDIKQRRVRRGLHITEAVADDDSGKVKVVWFNQPYRASSLKTEHEYYISGDFNIQRWAQITNPNIEVADDGTSLQTARILPTYRESGPIKSILLRKLIKQVEAVINGLPDPLPDWIIDKYGLVMKDGKYLYIRASDSE